MVKFGRCSKITTSTLNISTCDNYTLNNETFDSSGVYRRTIPNSSGCDSVITLNLIINKKFTLQTKAICEGAFFFAGGANRTLSGTYIDTLQTSSGCDSIVSTNLVVNPNPSPNLGADKDLCENTQLVLTPGSFENYSWQNRSKGNSFTVNGSGVYWVTVTNRANCTATDTFTVKSVLPLPANFLKATDSLCAYESLHITSAKAFSKYQWSDGAKENKIKVEKPGTYSLKVTDANGCVGTDSITILQKQCMLGVYIPTAFTPNMDGKNDFFKAIVFGKVLSFNMQVFNRAGQLIFQTTDPTKHWDGRYKGIDNSIAVYVWQCFYHLEAQQPGFQKRYCNIGALTFLRAEA